MCKRITSLEEFKKELKKKAEKYIEAEEDKSKAETGQKFIELYNLDKLKLDTGRASDAIGEGVVDFGVGIYDLYLFGEKIKATDKMEQFPQEVRDFIEENRYWWNKLQMEKWQEKNPGFGRKDPFKPYKSSPQDFKGKDVQEEDRPDDDQADLTLTSDSGGGGGGGSAPQQGTPTGGASPLKEDPNAETPSLAEDLYIRKAA